MTAPLATSTIDSLLEELHTLETRAEVPLPAAPTLVAPLPPQAPTIIYKKQRSYVAIASFSLLFFISGLFLSHLFVADSSPRPLAEIVEEISPLQASLEQLASDRHSSLIFAIDSGSSNINEQIADSNRLTSLALLQEWHKLGNPSLKESFIELATKYGLQAFLPAQITGSESSRPLYYLSDSPLHMNLATFHQKIIHDIP